MDRTSRSADRILPTRASLSGSSRLTFANRSRLPSHPVLSCALVALLLFKSQNSPAVRRGLPRSLRPSGSVFDECRLVFPPLPPRRPEIEAGVEEFAGLHRSTQKKILPIFLCTSCACLVHVLCMSCAYPPFGKPPRRPPNPVKTALPSHPLKLSENGISIHLAGLSHPLKNNVHKHPRPSPPRRCRHPTVG